MEISRRPENSGDEAFLRRLISETAAERLGAASWPQALREPLLEVQYRARRTNAATRFPQGLSEIIVVDGQDAGWLYLAALDDQIRVVEIALLAEYRGKGAGSAVLRELLAAADRAGKPVRLGVDAMNDGAIRLYRRLGFRRINSDPMQWEMEYTPQPPDV